MADISQTPTPAEGDNSHFEADLERAEKRLREERSHRFMTDHEEGIGPTLGQDLLRPNPGHEVDWNADDYDPPT
jgi:hypothetical protein